MSNAKARSSSGAVPARSSVDRALAATSASKQWMSCHDKLHGKLAQHCNTSLKSFAACAYYNIPLQLSGGVQHSRNTRITNKGYKSVFD